MNEPTLFDSAHDQAVRDMITELRRLLSTSTSEYERGELRTAIQSWEAALEPPVPTPPCKNKAAKCLKRP